jgi:hypothetical protein
LAAGVPFEDVDTAGVIRRRRKERELARTADQQLAIGKRQRCTESDAATKFGVRIRLSVDRRGHRHSDKENERPDRAVHGRPHLFVV